MACLVSAFKTIGKDIAPVPGLKSPALWGTRARLEAHFGKTAKEIRTTKDRANAKS
jgi:hypothetical protein